MADRHPTPVRVALACLLATSILLVPSRFVAAKSLGGATNSRSTRDEATRALPLAKLDPKLSPRIQRVVANPSIYRRLPTQAIDCDPRMYHFLINNPEVIVNIWQVMGISKVKMTRTGPTSYEATDGAGAAGTVQIAYSDRDTQVIYCEGNYEGPVFSKPLRAQCVLLIKAAYTQENGGRYVVTTRCDAFISMENVGVELLAKTFQPMVNKSADINFVETTAFVSSVSRTSEQKPAGVIKLGNKLQNISPEVREKFINLTKQVAARAQQNRSALAQSAPPQERSMPQMRAQNNRRR